MVLRRFTWPAVVEPKADCSFLYANFAKVSNFRKVIYTPKVYEISQGLLVYRRENIISSINQSSLNLSKVSNL